MDIVAYYDSLSPFELFLFQTQNFWYVFTLALLVIRTVLNNLIHHKTESPSVRATDTSDMDAFQDFIPKSTKERESQSYRETNYQGPAGMRDFEFFEFLIICVFSFHWVKGPADSPRLAKMKRISNVLSWIFIPLAMAVVVMFFQLQEANHVLRNASKDMFYFLR